MSNLATIVNNILADSGIDDINVVVTTGSYNNPAFITALAWTKITGVPSFVTSVTASSPLFSSGGTTPNLTIQQASGSQNGFLSSTDWTTFNSKQNTLSLTTTGTSGAATFIGTTLNIPIYQTVLTNPVTGTGNNDYIAKFTSTGSTIGNSLLQSTASNVFIFQEDSSFGIDAQANTRLGFTKKGGAQPYLTYAADPFIIASTTGTSIAAGNTFTPRLTIGIDGVSSFGTTVLVGTGSNNGSLFQVNGEATFGGATEKLSMSSQSLGFNRRVFNGFIYDTNAFAYQFQHTQSTSSGSDYLALQVYNTTGGNVTVSSWAVNGNGNMIVGGTGELQGGEKLTVISSLNTAILAQFTGGASGGWAAKFWNNANSGDNLITEFLTNTSITARGSIRYDRAGNRLNIVGEGSGLLFTGSATFSNSATVNVFLINGQEFYYAPANYASGGFTRLLGRNASTGRIEGMSAADIQSFIGLGNYLPLSGGTLTGALTISTVQDNKLILRVPSGDSSDWNYIDFVGANGVRDSYFGTDSSGTPTWFRDDNNVNIQLGSVATVNGVQIVTNSGTWGINVTGSARFISTIDNLLTTQGGNGLISYSSAISHPQTGLFPAVDNSNSILTLNRHPDNYYSQFGFSSNGQLYYRAFSAVAINTSQPWQNLLTSSNYNSYSPTLTGGGASGTWGINVTGTAGAETLATVTARGSSTSTSLNLLGRVNIGNDLARPAFLNSDGVAQARIGGADVHLYVASLSGTSSFRVAMQAARTSDFASFGLDLQSNGGPLFYGGVEVVRNTGSWSINAATATNSTNAANVQHLSGRTDGTWYNAVWAAGNPSPMYSCNAVQIKSDEGGIRANYYYDNQDTGYYLRPSGFSNLRTVHINGFTQFALTTPNIPANFGNARVHLRVHPVSSGARIMSFKMMISSTWNWVDSFGFISADVSFYFDGSGFYAASTTITSATGRAMFALNIGQPVIENGFVSIPIFSVNSNTVFVKMEGAPSFDFNAVSYGAWESVAFPGTAAVRVPGAISVGGSSSFDGPVTISTATDGMLTLRNPSGDSNEWNYMQFTLRNGTRRAFFGLDGGGVPIWYRDDNGLNVTLGSTFTVSGAVTATAFFESSDARLKSNIINLDVDASSIVAKHYIKNGVEEIGYLAQDIETILPSAISKRDDGFLDLSYRQVHTAKIAALEKEVKELKEQLKNK